MYLDPARLAATDATSETQPVATTQQLQKPKAPTGSALPLAPTTAPTLSQPATPGSDPLTAPKGTPAPQPAPIQPPPLSTNDPMAFAPVTSAEGQTFVGGTQPTDANGNVTGNGVLGYGFVPGSNGQLTDLGGGMWAPTPGADVSNGVTRVLDPILPPGYGTPEWFAGTIGSPSTEDMNAAAIAQATGQPLPAGWSSTQPASPGAGMPPASGGSGYANASAASGNLVPASGPARLAPAPSPNGPATTDPAPGGATVTPSSGTPATTPAPGTPGAAPGSAGTGVSLTPTTIDNALTNFTISPNNTVDRVKLAQDALSSTIQNILDPQFQANERDANRFNFGAGRGVSGIARTSQGNIESDYNRQKTNLANTLLNSAVNGSIDDLYRNIGIAQQQQGFQAGQERTAFDEALQQLMLGSQGDPSNIDLILAQIFGSGAGAAGQAASNYVASQQQQQSQALQQQQFDEWLQAILQNGQNNTANAIAGQPVPKISTTPNSNVPGY